MKRCLAPLAGLLGLLLLSSLAIVALGRHQSQGQVYSLTDLQARLDALPARWIGRTVAVRAIAEPCPWSGRLVRLLLCADEPLVLEGTPTEAPVVPLPLVRAAPQPLLSIVLSLPLVGDLLPRSRPVLAYTPARFRVRILALPAGSCGGRRPCYEALWLDAAPGFL